jgi:hypothetical protein
LRPGEVYRLLAGDDEAHTEIAMSKITEVSVEEMEGAWRKFIRRLPPNLLAEPPDQSV